MLAERPCVFLSTFAPARLFAPYKLSHRLLRPPRAAFAVDTSLPPPAAPPPQIPRAHTTRHGTQSGWCRAWAVRGGAGHVESVSGGYGDTTAYLGTNEAVAAVGWARERDRVGVEMEIRSFFPVAGTFHILCMSP